MTDGGRSGSTLLQDEEGYTFSYSSRNKIGIQRWQCSRKKNLKCTSYVKVENSQVKKGHGQAILVNQHCHQPFKLE